MTNEDLKDISRRNFLKNSSLGSLSLTLPIIQKPNPASILEPIDVPRSLDSNRALDLSPARWIWYPMARCLANTVVLFRREITLSAKPVKATGYILGDSRYLLFANGERVQFGPAPADPRFAEADPIDLTNRLKMGRNVIGAQVLFYGHGEGTWPIGKPGFIFKLDVELANGEQLQIVSDGKWQSTIARSWPPGHYKRWYLRAFQEEFDARLYPYNWNNTDFEAFEIWPLAMELSGDANKPAINTSFSNYADDVSGAVANTQLRRRSVPMLQETLVSAKRLAESAWVQWRKSIVEYFEFLTPNAFEVSRSDSAFEMTAKKWTLNLDGYRGALLTFEFEQQNVGFPYFTIDAPSGTVIELMVQESHVVGGSAALLNTKFHSWTRFICKSGTNYFETFDYESFRWLQLHIHGEAGLITVSNVGIRRRQFPWPNVPQFQCNDPKIQRVLEAAVNTLHNCAQETIVDGMARERQQYSGDCGHQLHAIQQVFGDTQLHARFVNTFSQGMTLDGYFLDAWPAYDRLARLMERQMELTPWGPLLDHGIGFNFDCWYYYLYTGDASALKEVFPRLVQFFDYLLKIRQNSLLPVENIGVPVVWIDHDAYKKQRHKQCAFNLYAVAMLKNAFAPLCQVFKQPQLAAKALAVANELHLTTIKLFWNVSKGLFVNNLPWKTEEKEERLCDRSLATALLFDLFPNQNYKPAAQILAKMPPNAGFSYPANANWRYWALAKAGNVQPILDDFRTRWYNMNSVQENNTLQESWQTQHDAGDQWSHCPVAPLFVTYMGLAGIQPTVPGCKKVQIRPQLGDLNQLSLTAHTVKGPILFRATGNLGRRNVLISLPAGCEGELVVPNGEKIGLTPTGVVNSELKKYRLPAGKQTQVILQTV